MQLAARLKRMLRYWRNHRAAQHAVVAPPDPADCGTAWGLDLTLPPPLKAKPAARRPRH